MPEIATPHRTRPVEVLITEPLTTANRGEIARWLEDQGIAVGVPALTGAVTQPKPPPALLLTLRDGIVDADFGDRVVVARGEADVLDQAHYKLWYEPVEAPAGRTEP